MDDIEKLAITKIEHELDFNLDDNLSEDELLYMIEQRVKYFLENNKDMLQSYLYRLDIPQSNVNAVLRLTNVIPAEKSLALLIYKRQLERVASKIKYKQKPIEGWDF